MRIHVGCELSFDFPQTMPMIATLNVHFSRFSDLERPDHLVTKPSVPVEGYRDSFGNWCSRLVAPTGRFTLGADAIVRDPGAPDPVDKRTSGEGTVYATSLVCRAATPETRAHVPYNIVLVDTAEGFRMMAHGDNDLAIGDKVTARFAPFAGRLVPYFAR